jgi:YD repeat-containing protein
LRQYGEDFAEWSVTLGGSAGSGRLYGVANHVGPTWEFSRLTFVPANGGSKINLTPKPARINLQPGGPRKIYLVPESLDSDQSLDWAPAYYKEKFGADVEILPAVPLTAAEKDEKRNQYVAEKCIQLITRSYPEQAGDPSSVLIAVTSRDLYISAFDWQYAENLRWEEHLAVVSDARLHPTDYPGRWNRELLSSRLQKMLTKNIAILYANLPLSDDYTSLLSSGILTGKQVDYMSEEIVGAEGRWVPSPDSEEPAVSIGTAPGRSPSWTIGGGWQALPNLQAEYFITGVSSGLLVQHQVDFYLDDEDPPLAFARTYISTDNLSRSFGVGTNDNLDIFLTGQMGSFFDLNREGGKSHFVHVDPKDSGGLADLYRATKGDTFIDAIFEGGTWRLRSRDGWTYFFPYRPKARTGMVTVLTGFLDPKGRKYEMVRSASSDLLSITTPSGKWLHFEHDDQHRIHRIEDSKGRTVQYDYNSGGQLARVTDSDGNVKAYTYNDRNEMLSVSDGRNTPLITNEYTSNDRIRSQTLTDGLRFEYSYRLGPQMIVSRSAFKDPNGIVTYFDNDGDGDFVQSLPTQLPR